VTLEVKGAGETSTASRTILVRSASPAGTCEPDARTLCLLDSRYAVRFDWWHGEHRGGSGYVVHAGTNSSGLFQFVGRENWELLVKLLDGCSINGKVWVFGAAATNLGYRLTVTDTATGVVREYENRDGAAAAPITDTGAFPMGCAGSAVASGASAGGLADLRGARFPPALVPPRAAADAVGAHRGSSTSTGPRAAASPESSACAAGRSSLCLQDGRYEVRVNWQAREAEGPGFVLPQRTGNSGLYYFFSPDNWEVLLKVLDGCSYNGHHWVLAAYATDVALDIEVRDTRTGFTRSYTKEAGGGVPALVDVAALPEGCSSR